MFALVLVAYAVAMGTVGAAWLRQAVWPLGAPRLGVLAWQALSVSVVASLLLAGLSLLAPAPLTGGSAADLLDACLTELRAQFSTPAGMIGHGAAAALTLILGVRVSYLVGKGLVVARRDRLSHLLAVRLSARRDEALGALIVDHPLPVAYCLPGRAGTVVLTSAATSVLDEVELAAVLAHERAHLSGRHHLVMATSRAMASALPFLPGLAWARSEQARLLEMIADDAAAGLGGRQTVASALVRMAEGGVPVAALAAADVAALDRVHRLVRPKVTVGWVRRLLIAVAIGLAVATPLAVVSAPALTAGQMAYCAPSQTGV